VHIKNNSMRSCGFTLIEKERERDRERERERERKRERESGESARERMFFSERY